MKVSILGSNSMPDPLLIAFRAALNLSAIKEIQLLRAVARLLLEAEYLQLVGVLTITA